MIDMRRNVISVLLALAGCATTHSTMMRSANDLERSVDAFVSDAGRDFPDAREFANQAHDFLETADRAGDREIISAYEHLWDAYHALRHEVERSGSRRAQVDFKPVTQAFIYVVRDIRGYANADSSVYARGGFQHDQYYDP
jgi:hypothetical protein